MNVQLMYSFTKSRMVKHITMPLCHMRRNDLLIGTALKACYFLVA